MAVRRLTWLSRILGCGLLVGVGLWGRGFCSLWAAVGLGFDGISLSLSFAPLSNALMGMGRGSWGHVQPRLHL